MHGCRHPCDFYLELTKSDGCKLGIDVDGEAQDKKLLVVTVKSQGLIAKWNNDNPNHCIQPGDYFVEANNVSGSALQIKAEIKRSSSMRIGVQRAGLNHNYHRGALIEEPFEEAVAENDSCDQLPAVDAEAPLQKTQSIGKGCAALPRSVWSWVMHFLPFHEILGRVATLSSEHVAILADENTWATLSLPRGADRLERLLRLLIVEEKNLWTWPLLHVENVDLDFRSASWTSLDLLEKLLFHSLDTKETLQTIRLRNVPMKAEGNATFDETSAFQRKLVTLVNPVMGNYPASGFRTTFLLIPGQLGQLRHRLSAFGTLRLETVREDGCRRPAFHFYAQRSRLPTVADLLGSEDGGMDPEATAAERLLEVEIGDLQHLPDSGTFITDNFNEWQKRLVLTYRNLVRSASENYDS
mmetsp:Transcript_68069/g.142157  ORF Transcript_68069/g.142157 Transcript_68069/m.142157 type:complete len:412 (+) Transcript_68069:96-1331(+)